MRERQWQRERRIRKDEMSEMEKENKKERGRGNRSSSNVLAETPSWLLDGLPASTLQ